MSSRRKALWRLVRFEFSHKRSAVAGSNRSPCLTVSEIGRQIILMKFAELALSPPLLRSLQEAGYEKATPIQAKAIPHVLQGRDLIGCAQTGTGKTAAFSLPTLHRLSRAPARPSGAQRRRQRSGRRVIRCLILTPTRELAGQIGDSLGTYGCHTGLRHAVIFGGVRQGPQVRALQAGIDTLVATPGRLLDLMGQGLIDLSHVEILILDEADQMLDMGFIHDLRKIVAKVPLQRQTLMFSATMPAAIRELADQWLRRPVEVKVAPVASTPDRVAQSVFFVERHAKAATLSHLLQTTARSKTLVFSRTKRGADKIARILERDGIRALAIHGNKSQARRTAVMGEFNGPRPPVLVATDLAARGLDFSDISHVINYDLPEVPETYVHRIGRTARAGAAGQAISFCDSDERKLLRMIERLTGRKVPVKKSPPVATGKIAGPPSPNAQRERTEPGNKRSRKGGQQQESGRGSSAGSGQMRYGNTNQSDGTEPHTGGKRPAKQGNSRRAKRPATATGKVTGAKRRRFTKSATDKRK